MFVEPEGFVPVLAAALVGFVGVVGLAVVALSVREVTSASLWWDLSEEGAE